MGHSPGLQRKVSTGDSRSVRLSRWALLAGNSFFSITGLPHHRQSPCPHMPPRMASCHHMTRGTPAPQPRRPLGCGR